MTQQQKQQALAAATQYVNQQLQVMKTFGSAPRKLSASEKQALAKRIVQASLRP